MTTHVFLMIIELIFDIQRPSNTTPKQTITPQVSKEKKNKFWSVFEHVFFCIFHNLFGQILWMKKSLFKFEWIKLMDD